MDFFARQAVVMRGRKFCFGTSVSATSLNLTAGLRSVIFISKTTLGTGFDLESGSLSTVSRSDQGVVGTLGFCYARYFFAVS